MPSYSLLGVRVDALTEGDLSALIREAAARNERHLVLNHNLHSLYLYHHDPAFRKLYDRADHVHVDGMPLVWAGRLLGYGLTRENRLTSVDWLPHVLKTCAEEGLRVYFLGSEPGVPEGAAARFREGAPGLRVETHHGYFDAAPGSPENERVLREIDEYRPHALMVGMGMPRQERWILENLDRLQANTIWNLGAFMDYAAGAVPTPPRWMARLGLEWLARFAAEPRRLWRRYLLEPPFALVLLARDLARRYGPRGIGGRS
ncbi:WecB/TagA/CpsF family glycosyltransferase [Rubrobacter marinus]|uniref:WecB/TagA/CpsF family glycosyltransferase n=1 Tax=Rubrobacter marinus TaxID=2653852 RepID=UPI001D19466F|nr:WecB/TagA/CpsF family glycosyltransferase [Rubrobacter marinus]